MVGDSIQIVGGRSTTPQNNNIINYAGGDSLQIIPENDANDANIWIRDAMSTDNPLDAFYCFFRCYIIGDKLPQIIEHGTQLEDYQQNRDLILRVVSDLQFKNYFTAQMLCFFIN